MSAPSPIWPPGATEVTAADLPEHERANLRTAAADLGQAEAAFALSRIDDEFFAICGSWGYELSATWNE